MQNTDNLRIQKEDTEELKHSEEFIKNFPINEKASEVVTNARHSIHNILYKKDDRLVVIIGPCSVHDPKAALEYAKKLQKVAIKLEDDLLIVMRIYFEKPRTTVGWKGLINDPYLDNSFKINDGLEKARSLLLDINTLGLPTATEYLDPIMPQYIADLISWGAIGARTTESQIHRELASGLSCPVGFKNSTDGKLQIAIDAVGAASHPHHFLSFTKHGEPAIFHTTGNEDCHIILRGGKKPNYDTQSVAEAIDKLKAADKIQKVMVDFSHANSSKKYKRQLVVGADITQQIESGNKDIMGVMIESNLVEGNQKVAAGQTLEDLTYGQSITDSCISWEDSEQLLYNLATAVQKRRATS